MSPSPAKTVEPAPRDALDLRTSIAFLCSTVATRFGACIESMYATEFGLSLTGWRVMVILARHAPLSAKEVSQHSAMDPVQVTRAINQLAKIGMVTRRTDVTDRRRIVLRLSRKGVQTYDTIIPLVRGAEAALLAEFTAEERATLMKLAGRLFTRAEAVLPDGVDWRTLLPADDDA